ncbi:MULTISPECIES: ABC transporter permease [unclassified Leptolyngbya]|uniref:ABC transporter permease n=1 Tax=unclassified Leptolyngbya TaxID=2650499 RepID=UPI0016862CE5|nr:MULTISPECIES: ABC transporter permease [unclassified Leptolyngbya]MBD1910514.1 ABC transporter permease [Leptolyngbya sp. FACHB-8]MBD2153885.1 ABC transporter permease [Leptolyngbya sp. FACHB-16]
MVVGGYVRKTWTESLAVARRILLELFHRRRSLIFWAIFPALVLVLNALILQERAKLSTADAFANAAPPSLVGAALFFSCLGGSVATVVAEREHHTLKRLFLSPLSGFSYFLGIFVAHSVIGLGQTLLVWAIALSQGSEFQGNPWLGVTIILLSILAYVGVGFILGTQLARRTEDVNALVATFGVPLLILGGTFLPASLFPDSLLRLAKLNPIYHMNEALLSIAANSTTFADISKHFWFLAIFAGVMVLAGWLSYLRMLQVERRL